MQLSDDFVDAFVKAFSSAQLSEGHVRTANQFFEDLKEITTRDSVFITRYETLLFYNNIFLF